MHLQKERKDEETVCPACKWHLKPLYAELDRLLIHSPSTFAPMEKHVPVTVPVPVVHQLVSPSPSPSPARQLGSGSPTPKARCRWNSEGLCALWTTTGLQTFVEGYAACIY